MKLAVYVDISNLYYCIRYRHKGKLNYDKLLDFIAPIGDVILAKAYGAQTNDEAKGFIEMLHNKGFETFYKTPKFYGNHEGKADWDVGIAIDIIRDMPKYEAVVLCSADGDMLPALEYVKEQGKTVIIIGAGISTDLQQIATCIEIPESMVIKGRRHAAN